MKNNILNQSIIDKGVIKEYKKNETIISKGAYKYSTGFVLEGTIKAYIEEKKASLFLYDFDENKNNVIHFMNLFQNKRIPFYLRARTESTILWVSNEEFLKNVEMKPKVRDIYHANYSQMINTISNYSFKSLEKSVCKYLKAKSLLNVGVKVIIAEMALDLNASPVSISRILNSLEKEKKIIKEKSIIRLN